MTSNPLSTVTMLGLAGRCVSKLALWQLLRPRHLRKLAQGSLGGSMALLRIHARCHPERPALISDGMRLSWGAFDDRVLRLAHGLRALGVEPGDKVVLLCDNGHEIIETLCAVTHLSAFAAALPVVLSASQAGEMLSTLLPKVLIVDAAHRGLAEAALAQAPAPLSVVVLEPQRYESLLSEATPNGLPKVNRSPGQTGGLVSFTSGTTNAQGVGKIGQRQLGPSVLPAALGMIDALPLSPDDRHLVTCPLSGSAGPAYAGLVLLAGGCLVIPRKRDRDADEMAELIHREKVTCTALVPDLLRRLLRSRDGQQGTLRKTLRWVVSTAAPLPTSLARQAEAALGPVLYNVYAATETGFISIARPGEHGAFPGTVGRPLPSVRVTIDRAATDGPLGEVLITQATGRISVGDLGYFDPLGNLHLAGRSNQSHGGIYPQLLSQAIEEHPLVAECVVHHNPATNQLVAIVELAQGATKTPTLLAELRELSLLSVPLGTGHAIDALYVVDTFPRTSGGKIRPSDLLSQASLT